MYLLRIFFLCTLLVLSVSWMLSGCTETSSTPKNIIFFISDGCGYNQVNATSLYQFGETGRQIYEQFPVRLAMSTYSTNTGGYDPDSAWTSFKYVLRKPTDSAASATAMATGYKTYNKAIGVDTSGRPLGNAVEHFESKGKSTGVITSVPWTHATPASFVAHGEDRGGLGNIASQMVLQSGVDVIMGANHPFYDDDGKKRAEPDYDEIGGKAIWDTLLSGNAGGDADGDGIADAWHFIQDRNEFQQMISGPVPKRVIGIAKIHSTLQVARDIKTAHKLPYANPFVETVPTLTEMALAAINILDENDNGFFLMIEGGAIDWAAHYNHLGRMVEEEIAFNKTVEAVCAWIESNSSWEETLVIVTGDHETGYLTGPGANPQKENDSLSREDIWPLLENNGKGKLPGAEWHTHGHTNSLIPFYSKGKNSVIFLNYADKSDPVRGKYLDNTAIGKVLLSF